MVRRKFIVTSAVTTISAVVVVAAVLVTAAAEEEEPAGLFLTWQDDPTTTMTIDWHTLPGESGATPKSILRYRKVDSDAWLEVEGDALAFPFSDRTIHRVQLTGLEPATDYSFQLHGIDRQYWFSTMPTDLSEPLVFATGGDVFHRREWMERTNRVVMQYEPQFIVWGGDLAYANGLEENVDRWEDWFEVVMDTLITDSGRVIPIIVGIGNHEVIGGQYDDHEGYDQTNAWRERIAPYFFSLFAFPGHPGYGVLDFDDDLSIIILDTDHANPIEGAQTQWLESVLAERGERAHVIPVYHFPAYPSHREHDRTTPTKVRENWVPLFERHNVRLAFEHHDHTYKRTHPLRNGRIASNGIVYIGDGAWGVRTKGGEGHDRWYIDQLAHVRHAIIVTLHGPHQHLLVVDEHGNVIDEYPRTPQGLTKRSG